jgi:predicted nucleic acid-binding protein
VPRDLGPVLILARAHVLSSHDAAYIELAAREGLPLATRDSRLQLIVKRVGVRFVA